MKDFFRIMSFIKKGRAGYIAGIAGCSVTGAASSLLTAFVVKDLLDAAILRDNSRLINAVAMILGIAVGLCVLLPIFNYIFKRTVHRTMAEIRLMVVEHLQNMKVSYYDSTHSGEIISRANNDVQAIEAAFSENLVVLVSTVITGISSAALMFIFDWRTAIMLILLGIISAIANSRFAGPLRRAGDRIQNKMATLSERLSDVISGINVIKMFNIKNQVTGKFDKANNELSGYFMNYIRIEASQTSVNFLLGWLNFGGIMLIGAVMALYGSISFGSLAANIQLLNGVSFMFISLGGFVAGIQGSIAGAVRVFEILDQPVEDEDDNQIGRIPDVSFVEDDSCGDTNTFKDSAQESGESGIPCLEIKNLVFSYEKGKRVLDDISLRLGTGCVGALAGPSGSGKSTLVKLLMGFYKPDSGDVRINGKSLYEYPVGELREIVSYVPQDAYLFEGTIRENIWYGRKTAEMEDIIEAAKMANAHEFIMELPEGYFTLVGERGEKLSGGQRQRIAIARAILKNAPVLLLDEATSALDSESEKLVQNALERLMEGKTVIAVAHRLSTIEEADMIYVMDKGKVIESGRHRELAEGRGLYNKLYGLQFV